MNGMTWTAIVAAGACAGAALAAKAAAGDQSAAGDQPRRAAIPGVAWRRGKPAAPVPPDLPPGRAVNLPGRGEVFIRDSDDWGDSGDARHSGGALTRPVVLLLHGWTASADINFFPAYASLAESYRVIGLDQRGHGRGMRSTERFSLEDCADDAAALLTRLGAGPAIVVGYSMGGAVALLLARRHPRQVAGLVMQATALEWQGAREQAVWRLLPVFDLGLRFGAGVSLVDLLLRRAAAGYPEIERYRPWLAAEFGRATARDLVATGRALSRYDARPWAHRLRIPATVLVTTRDHLVRPARQRELARVLGAGVLEADADHDLPIADGAEYARLTRIAVDGVAGAPAAGDTASGDTARGGSAAPAEMRQQ